MGLQSGGEDAGSWEVVILGNRWGWDWAGPGGGPSGARGAGTLLRPRVYSAVPGQPVWRTCQSWTRKAISRNHSVRREWGHPSKAPCSLQGALRAPLSNCQQLGDLGEDTACDGQGAFVPQFPHLDVTSVWLMSTGLAQSLTVGAY